MPAVRTSATLPNDFSPDCVPGKAFARGDGEGFRRPGAMNLYGLGSGLAERRKRSEFRLDRERGTEER